MTDERKHSWWGKIKRTIYSFFPVAENRQGECQHCGACCRLVYNCPFLRMKDGKSHCDVYFLRPPACRPYPRTENEQVTQGTCGYYFGPKRNIENPPSSRDNYKTTLISKIVQ